MREYPGRAPTAGRLAIGCCLLAWTAWLSVEEAAARPGTPTDVRVRSNGAWIYFNFRNTAYEPVVFDVEVTRNGQHVSPRLLSCGGSFTPPQSNDCHSIFVNEQGQSSQPVRQGGRGLELFTKGDYSTQYCLRARAREWNDARPWEGDVSELWSAWACTATSPIPPPPLRPPAPSLTYFPPVPERNLDAKVVVTGTYPALFNCRGLSDSWSELEWTLSGAAWGRIDQSGSIRTQREDAGPMPAPAVPCADRGWPAIHHLGGRDGRYTTVAPGDPMAYRVCAANDGGRTCSSPTRVSPSAAQALLRPGMDRTGNPRLGAPSVRAVAPSTYTRPYGQPPAFVDVELTFAGGRPTRARYNVDDGLRMAWYEAAELSVNGNVARVRIPYAPFREAAAQVHIKLSNEVGESIGTIQILAGYKAGPPPKVGTRLGPAKAATSPP